MKTTGARSGQDVAVIGYAARLPGAPSADAAWETLVEGRCNIADIPEERWSADRFFDTDHNVPGKTYARRAGLIDNVYDFDNVYFGFTPREAEQLDPQQRILLETVARAFDHAGIDPAALDKDRTGVFVGASTSDHSTTGIQDLSLIDSQYMLGNTLSVISNRIAYQWDLRGPSYTVDTACSSGLFALDQARRAIETGQVDTAIVGSVNMLLTPIPFIGFSKASMLSEVGLCQAFGKGGDGYVRAEGAVVFVLQRGDLARVSRNRVRSYVTATATNSDGRTPGIAMPSSDSQQILLDRVKDEFRIDPNDLAFVEAHGTGTAVGDPLEARAIGRAFGQTRKKPLPIGSAKTNFGHLEPASGLVGLLKAQMALERGMIPASLHAAELNPDIPFDELGIEVIQEATPLPERKKPWMVGVNSFGFGGANAHAILRQAPTPRVGQAPDMPATLRISAEDSGALTALAETWRDKAAEADRTTRAKTLAAQVANANQRAARHRHRLCVSAGTPEQLESALAEWLEEGTGRHAVDGVAQVDKARIGMVFSGNGSQWPGMGRQLFLFDPVFRDSFEKTNAIFTDLGSPSVIDMLMASDLPSRLNRAPVAQPLLLAIQIALVDSLAELGVRPHATLGHSAGELAAAYAAGAISREIAVRGIYARSQTMDQLFEKGAMAAIVCDVAQAQELIDSADLEVDIAAENSSRSLTLAGEEEDLKYLIKIARKKRIVGKMLDISYPYHSRFIEPLKDRMNAELQGLNGVKSPIALYSGCLGDLVPGDQLTPSYWWQNARGAVQFRQGVHAMARDGINLFLEISPKSVLLGYVRDNLEEGGLTGDVIGSLEETRAEEYDAERVAMSVLAHGGDFDEEPLLGPQHPFVGGLPDYPFTRQTFKLQSSGPLDIFGRSLQHALLGGRISPDANVWTSDLSLGRLPWLADHKVGGKILLPATAMLEIFTEAAAQINGTDSPELRNLEILRPVVLKKGETVFTRVTHETAARRLVLETRTTADWQLAAQVFCFENAAEAPALGPLPVGEDATPLYDILAGQGLDYGPAFARATAIAQTDGQSALIHLKPAEAGGPRFRLDPTVTDAALHGIAPLLAGRDLPDTVMYVPGRMGQVRVFGTAPIAAARLNLLSAQAAGICFDVTYLAADGSVVAEVSELRLRPMPRERAGGALYWDERHVAVTPTGSGDLIASALAAVQHGSDSPSDLEVIRDTIGGRLAWDIVTAGAKDSTLDRRFDLAVASLQAIELAVVDDTGSVLLEGDCPWPDIDTLVDLLATGVPEASDELFATLNAMATDHSLKSSGQETLRAATLTALGDGSTVGARTLLTGMVDPAVVSKLSRADTALTIAAYDEAEAERLRLTLGDSETCLITTLEDLPDNRRFDTVIGVGVVECLSGTQQKQVARLGGEGAELLLVETEPDLFEMMTSRYRESTALDDVVNMLRTRVEGLARTSWAKASNAQFITARYSAGAAADIVPMTVTGDGTLAEALRAATPEGRAQAQLIVIPEASDAVAAAQAQAEACRAVTPGRGLVWLVQDGVAHDASLRGWRRVLVNETGRDLRSVSVEHGVAAEEVLHLLSQTDEQELILSAKAGAMAPRIAPVSVAPEAVAGRDRYMLAQQGQGRIETLGWSVTPRTAPGADEVELEVAATGLNFRDVMWAQGLLPPELLERGFAGPTLGMECAGRVTRAGADSGFTEGQPVLAFSPNAFSSHVTVRRDTVMPLPDGIDPVQAASIPVIFVTADYALNELARVSDGDWVLIHGGAGGVGLAALQIAKRAGAQVIATAGSTEKRSLLRALGADEVFDSRSMRFVSDVQNITAGRGVDIVINSLAGEAMEQSLACLAPFGRFIELGKRDFVGNTAIGLRALKDNISYFGVDADQLLSNRPQVAHRVMQRVLQGFADEDYLIPPHRVFDGSMVDDAFRLMQKSGHIGKIVVTPPQPVAAASSDKGPDLSGAWLITGGTNGFGLATAEWLAGQGATDLWLVSRSGRLPDGAAVRLEAKGATIHLRAVDITNVTQLSGLIDETRKRGAPLAGVVHGAALFDDAFFEQVDTARIAPVLDAKLNGAHLLDAATRDLPLRHFWMFSSVATRFGNPGQGAYVAANMGLEGLARARRDAGLPGLAIAWGPIGDAGYLDRAHEVRDVIERKMGRTMAAGEALTALEAALMHSASRATLTIAPMEWARLTADLPVLTGPLFENLNLSAATNGLEGAIDLVAMISDMGEVKARRAVLDLLLGEASKIMRMAPSEIDTKRPLMDLGFDSLMGMNLKLAVEERIGTDLPVAAISDGVTFTRMAHDLIEAVKSGPTDVESDVLATTAMAEKHLSGTDLPEEIKTQIASAAGKG